MRTLPATGEFLFVREYTPSSFVEALEIGSPAGVTRTLQIFYFGLGTLIVVAAMGMWFLELISAPDKG